MKRYFLLFLVILSSFLLACSGDDSASSEDSFDPDGIATVNNGEGVDFSQYEDVWDFRLNESSEENDYIISGIIDTAWTMENNNEYKTLLFVSEKNPKNYRFVNDEFPSYCYYNMTTQELKLGTFKLYKNKNGDFCVRITVNKTKNNGQYTQIKEETKLYKYLVSNNHLYLYN